MSRLVRSRTLPGAALLGLALLGSAGAQTLGAQNLDAYRQLKSALGSAVQDRAFSKARSLSDLQKAQQALDTLKPTIRSNLLAQGLDASLSSSRASLARSAADLEAQVTQARGLMRAVLYSQTLSALAAARSAAPPSTPSATLQNQSRLLAEEFGLDAASRSSFLTSASRNLPQAQRLLDQAAARKVQGYLGAVNLADRAGAYLNLTRAASWYTAVQGAPAAGNLQVDQFASAFSALTGGDSNAARSALQTLRTGAARFVQSAASGSAPSTAAQPTPAAPAHHARPGPQSGQHHPGRAGGRDDAASGCRFRRRRGGLRQSGARPECGGGGRPACGPPRPGRRRAVAGPGPHAQPQRQLPGAGPGPEQPENPQRPAARRRAVTDR